MKGGCFKETLRISETDCDAMRALARKLLLYNNQATKIVSGWSGMRKGFKQFAFSMAQVAPPDDDDFVEESDNEIAPSGEPFIHHTSKAAHNDLPLTTFTF